MMLAESMLKYVADKDYETGEDLDITSSKEDLADASTEDVENPGETVLTSVTSGDSDYAAKVKLNREQVRSKNKETLHETYMDRNQSGKIGIYHADVERMFHYYVRPQATGNRTDVRWMQLADEAGEGLAFRSDASFQFSVIPFTDENLDAATHINQLRREGVVTVHLDAAQAGVGTATCGPGVLPQYRVPVQDYTFRFTIRPLK